MTEGATGAPTTLCELAQQAKRAAGRVSPHEKPKRQTEAGTAAHGGFRGRGGLAQDRGSCRLICKPRQSDAVLATGSLGFITFSPTDAIDF